MRVSFHLSGPRWHLMLPSAGRTRRSAAHPTDGPVVGRVSCVGRRGRRARRGRRMRIGLMIGSDRERPRSERLSGLVSDGCSAEEAGFTSVWIPQVPGYLDAMTALAVLGQATARIELGTSVVPIQTRHPIALAQQALTT